MRARNVKSLAAGVLAGWGLVLAGIVLVEETTIPDWLVKPLQRPDTTGAADAIVVLGASAYEPCGLSLSALRRTMRGVDVWRRGRAPLLVLSGGPTRESGGRSISTIMADFARRLGATPETVVEEDRSRNTWENALYSSEILRKRGVRRVLLVTDSIHMRRAEGCFLRLGFDIERSSVPQVCVSSSNLDMLRGAVHEYAGWLYYAIKGYTTGPAR